MIFYSIIPKAMLLSSRFHGLAWVVCDVCHRSSDRTVSNVSRFHLEELLKDVMDEWSTVHRHPLVLHLCSQCRPKERCSIDAASMQHRCSIAPKAQPEAPQVRIGRAFLVDGENILRRCYHATKAQGGAARTFMRSVAKASRRHKPARIIVCWDGGSSPQRLELLPTYRVRSRDPEQEAEIAEQRELARRALSSMGISSLCYPQTEADDVIAYIDRHCDEAVIFSGDRDFLQLVRDRHFVHQARPHDKPGFAHIVSPATFAAETGLASPATALITKALAGDQSDGVKGVPKIGLKTARQIIESCQGIGFAGPVTSQTLAELRKHATQRLEDNWQKFELCLRIIDLWSDEFLPAATQRQIVADLAAPLERSGNATLIELGLQDEISKTFGLIG